MPSTLSRKLSCILFLAPASLSLPSYRRSLYLVNYHLFLIGCHLPLFQRLILSEKQREGERGGRGRQSGKERSSIHWFIPQTPSMAELSQAEARVQELPPQRT